MLIFIISIVLVALAIALLSVKIILKKDGRFPSSHVGSQKSLSDKGIGCHTSQHWEAQSHKKLEDITGKI